MTTEEILESLRKRSGEPVRPLPVFLRVDREKALAKLREGWAWVRACDDEQRRREEAGMADFVRRGWDRIPIRTA